MESLALGQIGIKTIRSIGLTFTATKARFSNANFSSIQSLHTDLVNSIDDLPLSSASRLTRSYWSDAPIILNILNGSSSCSLDAIFSDDKNLISSAVMAAVANNMKVQKHIYQVLSDNFF